MERLTLNPAYAGRTKTVAVYSLGGRMINRKTLINNIVDLQKDFGVSNGVYVVKINAVQ
jgi:hypothetical protein